MIKSLTGGTIMLVVACYRRFKNQLQAVYFFLKFSLRSDVLRAYFTFRM